MGTDGLSGYPAGWRRVRPEHIHGAFQIHSIPRNDRRYDQVEAAGPVALNLVAALAHFP